MDDVFGRLSTAKEATFEQNWAKSCSFGTRKGVLKAIQDWATSMDDGLGHIYWLNGLVIRKMTPTI